MSIAANMKDYDYYTYSYDSYNQLVLGSSTVGKVKASIRQLNQETENTPLYENVSYVGLTLDKGIAANCVLAFGDKKLKVKEVVAGRYNTLLLQVIK